MKKANRIKIRMNSTENTGYFYVTYKNTKKTQDKLQLRKYDPHIRKHVMFVEAKI